MSVLDRHTVTLRAHGERAWNHFRSVQLAEELAGLLFHFFFFVLDEWNHVAENGKRGNAGISCAADGLHGDGHDGVEAEFLMKGSKSQDEADRGTVRVGDDVAAGLLAPSLDIDQLDVAAVDLGNDKGNVFLHAKGAGIRDYGASGVGKARLEFGGDRGIERGKDDFGSAFWCGGRNLHLPDGRRNRCFEAPARGVRIDLAFGAVGGGQPCHLEPRMVLQHLDKSLTNDASGAKNTYWNLFHGYLEFYNRLRIGPPFGAGRSITEVRNADLHRLIA